MTPPLTAVRGLVLRVRVSEPAILGPKADGPSWQSLARAAAGRAVVLDFAGVSRMDAGGLGILAAFAEAIAARGGYLRLARVPPHLRRMIEVTGLADAVGLHTAAT